MAPLTLCIYIFPNLRCLCIAIKSIWVEGRSGDKAAPRETVVVAISTQDIAKVCSNHEIG